MGLFGFFRRVKAPQSLEPKLKTGWAGEGVFIEFSQQLPDTTTEGLLAAVHEAGPEDTVMGAYLAQLVGENRCTLDHTGALIRWHDFFELHASIEHRGALALLGLPPQGALRPILDSTGTLSDPGFEITVAGWVDGTRQVRLSRLDGAIATVDGQSQMLCAVAWETVSEVEAFRKRSPSERNQHCQELAWGRIRRYADQAGALYATPYLETTLVLTPDTLRLPISKEDTLFGRVVTVAPTFENAPEGWLRAFDGFSSVQSHYDLTRTTGRVRVVISEPVRKVLSVIKREMPGRRVSGMKAEKFIHNPFAFLGDTAREVLSESEFEADRAQAGAVAAIFSVVGRMDVGKHLPSTVLTAWR